MTFSIEESELFAKTKTASQSDINKAINQNINNLIILISGVDTNNYTWDLTANLLIELVSTKKRLVPEFLKKEQTK